jgi:hypothetical protein
MEAIIMNKLKAGEEDETSYRDFKGCLLMSAKFFEKNENFPS